jgi:outer membrane receptor protein involved in Fe transport
MRWHLRALLVGAGAVGCGGAFAQTPASDSASTPGEEAVAEVTVTGSRIITNGNDSPTPVTVVTVDDMKATNPATVFVGLLDMPEFAGSRGATSSNPTGNAANSNQISALNLRGLGPIRTLLLYDGHRVPPTEQDGLVDANTIPQMLLQRVDIVTGGASAVYGSDAIGGVVNFITNRNFNGVKVELQAGISERRDDPTNQIGIAAGTNLFDGRGHIEGSFETHRIDGVLHRFTRDQFSQDWTVQGAGTSALPYFLVAGALNSQYSYGGRIATASGQPKNPLNNFIFATNGVLSPFVNGTTTGIPTGSTIQIGGSGIEDTSSTLLAQEGLDQGYGRFDFDLTDTLHYFLTASATVDHTLNYFGNVNSQNLIFSVNNAFLPATYPQQMAAAGDTTFAYFKKFGPDSIIPPSAINFFTHSYYFNTGLEGKLGDYKWEASYTGSDTNLHAKSGYTFNNGRLDAALDAVINPSNNQIVCQVSLTQYADLYPGCVPINMFGPNSESQASVDYVRQQGDFVGTMPTSDVSGSITGKPFNDWAGPVSMALSGEWRREGFKLTSTSPTVNYAPLDCTGLRFNCTPATATSVGVPAYNGGVAPRPPVNRTVSEAALEADVPMLKDLPLVRALDLNLAYRYAQYRNSGNPNILVPNFTTSFTANTWKLGVDWHMTDMLTVRATRSRDIRAPNLNDLYLPNGITFSNGNTDLLTKQNLTGTGAQPENINGGNPSLKPEVAATTTIGVVFDLTGKFSVAMDYYHITIADYITQINGASATFQNACYSGSLYYCSLQVRPTPITGPFPVTSTPLANAVTAWYVVPANVASLKTEGLDTELNYHTRLLNRALWLRGLVTYQPHILFDQPGSVTQDFSGAFGNPTTFSGAQLRLSVFAHYNLTENFTIDWQTNWRSRMHQLSDPTLVALSNTGVPAVAYSNLNLSYRLSGPWKGESTFFLNINNVFNQPAPIAGNYSTGSSPGLTSGFVPGDDPLGRYYYVGVRYRL